MRLSVHVLPDHIVLRAHQHSAGSIKPIRVGVLSSGNLNEEVGASVRRLAPLAHDVVQAEVELIERQMLLRRAVRLARCIMIRVAVVELKRRKHRVVVASVARDHVDHKCVVLVRLKRRRRVHLALRVAVQNVAQFLLLDGAEHRTSALGVHGKKLAGDRSSRTRLAVDLLVQRLEVRRRRDHELDDRQSS